MSLIVYIIVLFLSGLFVGALGRLALPGPDPMTLLQTAAVGIAGSFLAGVVWAILFHRNGGGVLGIDLALRIAQESIERLYPGGRLFLYTGTPVIAGTDQFFSNIRARLEERGVRYTYDEIDPDVFGEELEGPGYQQVDRIAVVALTVDV